MKPNLSHRCVLLLALLLLTCSAYAARRADHVFIISLDGGKPAVIHQSKMPTLNQLVAEGACTWGAQTIFPSITLPSHTSMLTGVLPAKHHITWNSYKPDAGVVQVPTVFALVKKAGCATAMFVGKEKFKHLLQPGTVDEFSYNRNISGEVTKIMAGDAKPSKEGTVMTAHVAANAAAYLAAQKPNLCFIHFTDTDSAGHKHGWGSPEQVKAFADEDAGLAVVLQAIRKAGLAASSVVIITADHGGHAKTHGANIPDDMTIPWIAWGKGVKQHFTITAPVMTCDTTATALWLLDVPRPTELDGQPVTSAFE
ncbi:MAG: phosphodiesterase [Verrucomicrobia bacterium]|nr:MAG: phosphodiesterase [Verrucomicrobiota bacterium]